MRALSFLIFLFLASPAWAGQWQLDQDQSRFSFRAVQIGEVEVLGTLKSSGAQICFDERDLENTQFEISFALGDTTTGVVERDEILASPAWLNVAEFPTGRFALINLVRLGPNSYEATGALSLKGVEREVTFPLTLSLAEERAEGRLTFDRRDFNIGEGAWGETEKWVNYEIEINFEVIAAPTGEACE